MMSMEMPTEAWVLDILLVFPPGERPPQMSTTDELGNILTVALDWTRDAPRVKYVLLEPYEGGAWRLDPACVRMRAARDDEPPAIAIRSRLGR
jgi:hypothetical protein